MNKKTIITGDSITERCGPRPVSGKSGKEIEDGLTRVTVCENSYSDNVGYALFMFLVVICIIIDLIHT